MEGGVIPRLLSCSRLHRKCTLSDCLCYPNHLLTHTALRNICNNRYAMIVALRSDNTELHRAQRTPPSMPASMEHSRTQEPALV